MFKHPRDSNKSAQIWRKGILRRIFVKITFETRKRNTRFYVFRQGVPEGRSSEGYASFKQVKPWPWHVEVIPGVDAVGLVTNKVLCQVIWGIIIKNFMHKHSFSVSELLFKIPRALIFCSVDREGSGRINLPALRCREFSFFKCTSPQPSHTTDA